MLVPGSENDGPWQYTRVQTSKLSNQNVALTSNQLWRRNQLFSSGECSDSHELHSKITHNREIPACTREKHEKKKKKKNSNWSLTDTQSNEREKGQRRLGWLGYCILNYSFVVAQAMGIEHGDDDSYYTWGNRHRNGGSCFTRELRRSYFTRIRNM